MFTKAAIWQWSIILVVVSIVIVVFVVYSVNENFRLIDNGSENKILGLQQFSPIYDFYNKFVDWLNALTLLNFFLIIIFTVALDIARNIGKVMILVAYGIKRRFKPLKLNLISKPKISILIPAHNESASIKKTIMSVLENTYPNKEIIIIDDHSIDDTYEQALPFYKSGQIKLVQRKGGIGSKARAINYGSMFATGDYLMIMDGDTLLERNALSEIVKYLNIPDVVAVSGNVRILSGDNGIKNLLTKSQSYEYLISLELGRRYNALMRMLLIIPGAFGVFSKETAKQIGFYDPDSVTEDFDLTLKLLKLGGRVEFVTNAVAWTFCPNNWKDWIRQRTRWSHGQLDNLLKHRDIFTSRRYKRSFVLAAYDMVFMDIILLWVRMVALVWLAFNFTEELLFVYLLIFLLYFVNEFIVIGTAIGFSSNKTDLKYLYMVPFVVTFYRPFYTYVRFYSYLRYLFKKETKW